MASNIPLDLSYPAYEKWIESEKQKRLRATKFNLLKELLYPYTPGYIDYGHAERIFMLHQILDNEVKVKEILNFNIDGSEF